MNEQRFGMLVGLRVIDDEAYGRYRSEMVPILSRFGGSFRRDYRVSESLAGGPEGVNRVFVIAFPDRTAKDAFFADAEYRQVRARHFDQAVTETDIVATFPEER